MKNIGVSKTNDDRIKVSLPYNPSYIGKIKTISGYKWHPEWNFWSFPDTDGTLEKILKFFKEPKPDRHIAVRTVQKIFEHACKIAKIKKNMTVRTLRHSIATQLLEDGTDLRYTPHFIERHHNSATI